MTTTPQAISGIDDPDNVRVQLYASNQTVHAPLDVAVEAGARGRLLPPGGSEGEVLSKASGDDYDVVWRPTFGLRAFANIQGGVGPTFREAYNFASVTRNGVGDYTAFYSESVSLTATVTFGAGDTTTPALYSVNIVAQTTGSVRLQVRNAAGALVDCDNIHIHVASLYHDYLLTSGDMQSGTDKEEMSGDAQPGVLETSGQE